eukprot:Rmarinus@m.15945
MTQPGIGMYPYGFPVPPYDVQTNLMDSLYTIIQQGDVGILESPTGTGKSLSIICGCLTWLHDEERRIIQGELKATSDSTPGGEDLPDWVTEHGLNAQRTNAISRLRARQTKLGGIKDRFRKQRMLKPGKPLFGNKPKHKSSAKADAALDSLILDECSDDGDGDKVVTQKRRRYYGDSSDSDDQKGGSDSSSSKSTDDGRFIPKIIYCTRTHSQLDQIVEELQKNCVFFKYNGCCFRIPEDHVCEPASACSLLCYCNSRQVLGFAAKEGKKKKLEFCRWRYCVIRQRVPIHVPTRQPPSKRPTGVQCDKH